MGLGSSGGLSEAPGRSGRLWGALGGSLAGYEMSGGFWRLWEILSSGRCGVVPTRSTAKGVGGFSDRSADSGRLTHLPAGGVRNTHGYNGDPASQDGFGRALCFNFGPDLD